MVLRSWSLRTQLLSALNIPLILLAAVYLTYDFRREMSERTREKWVALDEEAKTILPAIVEIRGHGRTAIQDYVDAVCSRMKSQDSPGHHIAVIIDGEILQAQAHHRASSSMVTAMRRAATAPRRMAWAGKREIIVGSHGDGGTTVLISEDVRSLKRSVWRHLGRRVVGFLLLMAVVGGVINFVVLRMVTVPIGRLVETVRQLAAGQLGARVESKGSAEFEFLGREINQLSEALQTADRYRSMQMRRAREIQQHVLPRSDSFERIVLASAFFPADEVGGDYYDVIELADGSTLLCIADVSGHGVAAAMLALLLRSLLHAAVEETTELPDVMRRINRRFVEASLPGDFATVMLVRFSSRMDRLEYVSAGHEACWIIGQDGDPVELASTGLILGIDLAATWDVVRRPFAREDWLVLLTDGVTETLSESGELFGARRLVELLRECRRASMEDAAGRIRAALSEFRGQRKPTDDVTVVIAAALTVYDRPGAVRVQPQSEEGR